MTNIPTIKIPKEVTLLQPCKVPLKAKEFFRLVQLEEKELFRWAQCMIGKKDHAKYCRTIYWRTLTELFTRHSYCALCNRKTGLILHHTTYKYKGAEWKYPQSVEVLCKPCHGITHRIEVVTKAEDVSYSPIPLKDLVSFLSSLKKKYK